MRMLELCDCLLREDPGAHAVETSPVGQVLTDIVRLFGPMAEERGVALDLDLPAELPELQVEVEALTSVVNNLVVNAIKFTPRGGRVSVSARVHAAESVPALVTSDPGVGMAPEAMARPMSPAWPGGASAVRVPGAPTGRAEGMDRRWQEA